MLGSSTKDFKNLVKSNHLTIFLMSELSLPVFTRQEESRLGGLAIDIEMKFEETAYFPYVAQVPRENEQTISCHVWVAQYDLRRSSKTDTRSDMESDGV